MSKGRRLVALLCGTLAIAVLPAVGISAAATAAQPGPGPLITAHHVTGCGAPVTVYTPAKPGMALSARALGLPGGPGSLLAQAAQRHVRWLSTLECQAEPRRAAPVQAPAQAPAGRAANYFLNWSGYVVTTKSPDYVQANWSVPLICCDFRGNDYSSIWPGLGEASKGTELIQAGTEQDISTAKKTSYYFWLELVPKEDQQRVKNLVPRVGDSVGVSVSYGTLRAKSATFVICDFTKGHCVSGTYASPKPDNHVEWIVERTQVCEGGHWWYPALAAFSVAEWNSGYYDLTGAQLPAYTIKHGHPVISYMVNANGSRLATPGALNKAGTAFLVVHDDYGVPYELKGSNGKPIKC